MDYRILGPLEVVGRDGALAIGGRKRRALVARLVIDANRVVPTDRLVADVWGDDAAASSATATVQTYISQLRRSLPKGALLTRAGGYVLPADPQQIDARRFESLLSTAATRRPDEAAELLGAALGLWRGAALADFADMAWAQTESARLEELRLGAVEARIEARLALGQHQALVGELEVLVEAYPLRERLWALLMTALYRAERQADALRAYARLRERLIDELGIEPAAEVRALEQDILLQRLAGTLTTDVATELPTGVVTFLLGDVEDSTALWEAHPDAMAKAVRELASAADEAISRHGGRRPGEQGEGDSFVAAFTSMGDALACALDLQRTELSPLSLRMGLHTGEAHLRDPGNYMGPTLNRAARVRDLGHGGQILLSGASRDLVADALADGVWLTDLGSHRLRGLDRAERIYQLCHPDLLVDFPPLRSADARPTNLTPRLTSFIGRGPEMAAVRGLLDGHRLVSVVGAGGCGKTRLALEVAAETLDTFRDGVYAVELAPVASPSVVAIAVARALGLRDEPLRSTTETITHHLRDLSVLVVLDNCEHLIDAAASLVESVLHACPSVRVLATSREPLNLPGEVAWRVPSMTLPADHDMARASEAVELFCDRAAHAFGGFRLTDSSAAAIAEICRRLDGMPLAIELAAARVRAMTPEEIAAGLSDRFGLLRGGPRTAMARQQTLRASIDWSYDLLDETERTVLRRLSVFAGGFDLAAVKAVGAGEGVATDRMVDTITSLVDKSFVHASDDDGASRYGLLETVRQYAAERLAESGEADRIGRAHRDYYLAFAQMADARIISHEQDLWLDRLEADLDNLRAAFEWSGREGDSRSSLQLAAALRYLWMIKGRFLEGLTWLEGAISGNQDGSSPTYILAMAVSAYLKGTSAFDISAKVVGDEAVSLARQAGDTNLLAWALFSTGVSVLFFGEPAVAYLEEAISLSRRGEDAFVLSGALSALGCVEVFLGELARARALLEEGLAIAEAVGDRGMALSNKMFLAYARSMQGDLLDACTLSDDAARDARSLGNAVNLAIILNIAMEAKAARGDFDGARRDADEGRSVVRDLGLVPYEAAWAYGVGMIALASGDPEVARRHLTRSLDLAGGAPTSGDWAATHLPEAELALGEIALARLHVEEALQRTRLSKMRIYEGRALLISARIAFTGGDTPRAEQLAADALCIVRDVGAKATLAEALEFSAVLLLGDRRMNDSAYAFGVAESLRRATGGARYRIYQDWYDGSVATLRDAMGGEAMERVWADGAALTLEAALEYFPDLKPMK